MFLRPTGLLAIFFVVRVLTSLNVNKILGDFLVLTT